MPKRNEIPMTTLVSHEIVERKIYLIRGKKSDAWPGSGGSLWG
jgi:hypothetical protein